MRRSARHEGSSLLLRSQHWSQRFAPLLSDLYRGRKKADPKKPTSPDALAALPKKC